jgi:hypothetical protein
MPIEIVRFGVGNRRPGGPPGSDGVTGQVIHSDARGIVSELAFERGGHIEPHSNPNTTYFIVIEGGGWTVVGDERLRVAAGDYSPMRAFVVEFAGADDSLLRGILPGEARELLPGEVQASKGEGELARTPEEAARHDRSEGEPV